MIKPEVIRNLLLKTNMNSITIHECVQDFDLSSLYPSIAIAFNICEENCYGIIEYYKGTEDKTEEFIDHYTSRDSVNFCNEYLNLPDLVEMIKIVDNELNKEGESVA